MGQIFEAIMVICFGLSWPANIVKSYRTRSTKGKSLPFLCFVLTGYLCGITSKLLSASITYVLIFYTANVIMVSIDIFLYFRNRKLDRLSAR
jgi:lipopolysaccharide export LptBFGC system permease protein LptF